MSKVSTYEQALGWVVLVIAIACIWFGFKLLHSYPLLPLIVMLCCFPIAFLIYKAPNYKNGSITSFRIVTFLLILNGVVSFYSLFDHERELSILNRYFFGGKVHKEEIWSEGDDEHEAHYVTEYTYEGKQSTLRDIFGWVFLFSVLVTPFITYLILKSMPEFDSWYKNSSRSGSDW